MRIFFSVGEPSGDLHGANLIAALHEKNPDWQFVGYGGPKMAAAGCQLHAELTKLAVMWFTAALWNLHRFLGFLRRADRYFREQRPDAVVLIDFPGFNWWIARRAKAHGIPVFYYGAPQLWAWAGYRIRRMRRYVDHVLCKLPFEQSWFRQRGCNATYLGHPYFDELNARRLDRRWIAELPSPEAPLVTILPGSRTHEVESNLADFLHAASRIAKRVPNVQFAVAAFNDAQADYARRKLTGCDVSAHVYAGRTAELIAAADCCLACSGSVSLELLYHAKPSVVLYRVGRVPYFLQQFFRKVRYITLVNLMTTDDPFTGRRAGVYHPSDPRDAHVLLPEYLTCADKSAELADHIVDWLNNPAEYERRATALRTLCRRVGRGGASQRAAEYIAGALEDAAVDATARAA